MNGSLINLNDTRLFLETLDPTGVFTFQAIYERPEKSKRKSSPIMHGTLAEHLQKLIELNDQGYGIFVMVNEGNGLGRKEADVKRVRANFIDLDGAPVAPALKAAEPHLVVETSPGKWHVYWLAADCPLSEFKARQKQLIQLFGGDRVVHDLPRIMRLPGFLHQKNEKPFVTRLVPKSEWKSLMEIKQ